MRVDCLYLTSVFSIIAGNRRKSPPIQCFFFRLSKSGKKKFRVCWSGPERHIFVSPVDWFRWSLIRSEWRAYFENQSIILNQCSVSSNRLFDHPHKDFCRSLRPWGDGRWNDLVFHNRLFQSKTDCWLSHTIRMVLNQNCQTEARIWAHVPKVN